MLEILVGLGVVIVAFWAVLGLVMMITSSPDEIGPVYFLVTAPWFLFLLGLIGWLAWGIGGSILGTQ